MTEQITPMSEEAAKEEADRIIATAFRDHTPVPAVGPTPPVPQPGRPPMSPKAVDDTARMLGASVLIATSGGATTAVLWASGYANPAVVACVFGAPTALVLALGRLVKRARPEPEVHQHFHGNVYQDQRNTETRGVWAKTINRK
jgi:hypothetical protein